MKKFNRIGYIAIGMVLALIIGMATPAFAATKDIVKQLTAHFTSGGKPITVYVNGTKIEKDANGKVVTPFTVDGTTYLPAKAIANALGKEVTWDGATASVKINDASSNKLNMPSVINDANAKLTTTVGANGKKIDSLDYKFTLDSNAVGEWEFFNWYFTEDILTQFDPNDTPHHQLTSLQTVSIYNDGSMVKRHLDNGNKVDKEGLRWTKNYLVDFQIGDPYIDAYAISTINGKTFMVVESKNGDYGKTGKVTMYDVFVKVSDTPAAAPTNTPAPASKIKVTKKDGVIFESMDYKFVTDKDAIGKWEQIDFVNKPEDFDSKDSTKRGYIPGAFHNFYADGTATSYTDNGLRLGTGEHIWTKGYIWEMGSADTISAYEIKQLNGKTFMFVEWKNGDYTVRGEKPKYYVFVKASDIPDKAPWAK